MVYTITAAAEPSSARITLTLAGGTPGDALYVFRRDGSGVGIVRDTSLGTLVWPASGPVVVYDYEATQGAVTDYLLTDQDGTTTATTNLTIPAWGTWLKSPGRPFLNVRCYLAQEGDVKRAARRTVVQIEGTPDPVVLTEARAGRQGEVRLIALDAATVDGIDLLLDSGLTLMLDTAPQWRSPWRYISVGDMTSTRAYGGGVLSLESPARLVTLSDVLAVEPPIGVTAVVAGRTYDTLPTLYANYAALAATNAQYIDLVV